VATGQLFIWSRARGEWVSCPPDEVTWLDRGLLSDNKDLTLHRAPRCAGLRHVHHRWELFSRDTTFRVYLAPRSGRDAPGSGTPGSGRGMPGSGRDGLSARPDVLSARPDVPAAEAVQRAAAHVLPVAPAHYEALPVVLEPGSWLVSVGGWVLPLRLDEAARPRDERTPPRIDRQPATRDGRVRAGAGDSAPDAAARVRGYFERNAGARLAMAYYYQQYIQGLPAPHPVPMMDVVIALNLSGEGAVSDYKKLLQGFIWKERGHARDLAEFLLSNGLLTPADLDQARVTAAENERDGVCEMARKRLRYRPKGA
jgi:hypothetical protein